MLSYNEPQLVQRLSALPSILQVAFAAACAERLFPAYGVFCRSAGRGDEATLREVLDRVWDHLLGNKMTVDQVQDALARCMDLIPGDDDTPYLDEQPYAEDAGSAAAYALRALEGGGPQEAGWAARHAYEALDHYVIHHVGIEDEQQILAHPLLQAEFARQERDVDECGTAPDPVALIARLRERAQAEAASYFGAPP
jgi:uncharacterized protein YjaG (DUF416 family)